MDLMEQIRLEAEKYADIQYDRLNGTYVNSAWAGVRDTFQAGAQALLNLLGRSATSEGHPPRIMMTYKVGGRPQVSTQPRMDCENHEYLSRQECETLRAADLLEIARQESQLKTWEGRCDRLTAALEKIANGGIPNGEVGTVEDRMIAMCDIAMKALAEAGKPEEPHPRGYR